MEAFQLYGNGGGSSDLRAMGKNSKEWDLNNWKWDSHLFIATSKLTPVPEHRQFLPIPVGSGGGGCSNSNSSSSCSEQLDLGICQVKEGERKRRVIVVEDELGLGLNKEGGNLSLNLGGGVATWEGNNGKKSRVAGGGSSSRAFCQVEDCRADLNNAKGYHRRHKVCEIHSKASKALVGNAMQRFCQQCSRFHLLQEFDEGKRSCRRRLAGHNKRRRKTNQDSVPNGSSPNDDQTSSYLLISLLKILSNMQPDRSNQTADQDLLTHLLRSLANQNGKVRPIKLSNNSYASSSINTSLQLQVTPNLQLDHGSWSLRGREFWYARRAFLNSYHLNLERENVSLKEKLKRLVKEVSEAAMRVALDMRRKMHKRRLGIRAYRVTMSLPSMFLVTMRCFMPWFNKKGEYVM